MIFIGHGISGKYLESRSYLCYTFPRKTGEKYIFLPLKVTYY